VSLSGLDFTYTSNSGAGSDSFTYRVLDSSGNESQNFTVSITALVTTNFTEQFLNVGSHTFEVPANVTSIDVVDGAGGSSGASNGLVGLIFDNPGGDGGNGERITTLPVSSGEILTLFVGQGGQFEAGGIGDPAGSGQMGDRAGNGGGAPSIRGSLFTPIQTAGRGGGGSGVFELGLNFDRGADSRDGALNSASGGNAGSPSAH